MRVLVAAASRHGATQEIAEEIGRVVEARGVQADVRRIEDVDGLGAYDAVVLGSAVYVGKWLEPAQRFVDRHAAELAARPTWLFSSRPIGDPPRPRAEEAVTVDAIVEAARAREHRLFAGKLDRSRLGLAERAVVRAFRAAEGDFRDWDEIRGWAEAIAGAIADGAVVEVAR